MLTVSSVLRSLLRVQFTAWYRVGRKAKKAPNLRLSVEKTSFMAETRLLVRAKVRTSWIKDFMATPV